MLGSLETPLQRNKSRAGDIARLVEHWFGMLEALGSVSSTKQTRHGGEHRRVTSSRSSFASQPGIHEICFKEDKKKMSNNKKN